MSKLKNYILIALGSLLVTGCGDSETTTTITNGLVIKLSAEETETMQQVQSFSCDLFNTTCELMDATSETNFVISPISTAITLGMLANGCDGDGQSQILKAFGYESDGVDALNEALGRVSKELSSTVSSESKLILANSIWINEIFDCTDQYKADMQTNYNAHVQSLSFSKEANIINQWCSEKTNGLINKLPVSENYEDYLMFLVNAVYFKAPWSEPFSTTKKDTFKNIDGTTSTVTFMQGKQQVTYWCNESTEFIVINYDKTNTKLIIAQCDEGYSFDNAYASMNEFLTNYASLTNVDGITTLSMPKFQINSTVDYQPVLSKLGITEIFRPENKCFAKINDSADLAVSKFSQSTKIIVDEKGSEASSVTSVGFGDTFSPNPQNVPSEIKIDRPFIYAICDPALSKAIIMMGRVCKL